MSPAALHAGSNFLSLMLDAAFRSLLLACFLAVVLGAFRVRAVRAKMFAWRSLLLVAIAMPLLLLISPAIRIAVPVPSFPHDAATKVVQSAQTVRTVAEYLSVQMQPQNGERLKLERSSILSNAAVPMPQAPIPGFTLPRVKHEISWPFIALGAYLAIALLFFARLLIGMYFGRRLACRAQPIEDERALGLLASTSRTAGLNKYPYLVESEILSVPVTLGVRRAAILFPVSWREWDRDELAAVMAHEVSHVARRDSAVQMLALIHRAIFWFSPLSWWLERHFAELAEQASDEAALAGGADQSRYAQALLGFLADLEASPARVWWHGVAMAKTGQDEIRVERILAWRSEMSNRFSRALAIALVAVCVPAVALSVAARPSAYQLQDAAVPPPPSSAPPSPPTQLVPPASIPAPPTDRMAIPTAPAAPLVEAQPPIPPPAPVAPDVAIPVPPQPAQAPTQQSAPPAPAPPPPVAAATPAGDWGNFGQEFGRTDGFYWAWGPPFVIVTRGSDHLIMSGSEEDAEHARALRSKISGDFIWFEHDGKSYIIRDQAIIDRAKKIWAERGNSAKLQQELRDKQRELSKEMHEQVQQKMREIRVKIPDMTAELQKLQSEIKDLDANGATLQQLGDLQREVGEMQQALGQARWNSNMQEITRRAGELGQQMGDLGRQIGEIARREVEQSRQAAEQMHQLLDNAVEQGQAKPE